MRITILGLILAVALYADAEQPEPAKDGDIDRLVARLSSRGFAAREGATKALIEIGAPALDALRKAMASPDAEVRRRATQVVRQIEQRVESEFVLKPTRVRLILKDTPVPDAVAELARKAGVPIQLQRDVENLSKQRITLDTGETSFWNALDQLCRKASLIEEPPPPPAASKPGRIHGTSIVIIGGGGGINMRPRSTDILKAPAEESKPILLVPGKPSALPVHTTEAIRVRLLPADAKVPWKSVSGDLILGLEATPEPRLLWKGARGIRIVKALDDQGQQLELLPPPQVKASQPRTGTSTIIINQVPINTNPPADEGTQGPVPVKLKKGDKPAKHLKELSGFLLAQVQPAPEVLVTIDDVLKAKDKAVKGARGGAVKVLAVSRQEDGTIKLRVQVESPAASLEDAPPVQANVQVFVNGERVGEKKQEALSAANFALLDEAGKAFKVVKAINTGIRAGAARELELTFQPQPGQQSAARFVYTGRRTTLVEVPFTFKDVPLP